MKQPDKEIIITSFRVMNKKRELHVREEKYLKMIQKLLEATINPVCDT